MPAEYNIALLEELGISSSMLAARRLCPFAEAEHLELAEVGKDGREHLLIPGAAAAWHNLKSAAQKESICVFIVSGYRSIQRQVEIVRRKLEAGEQIENILRVSAPPGFSEHHTGRAIDLSTPDSPPLEAVFDRTSAYQWLQRNAGRFGFSLSYPAGNPHGYQYEPWHWCFHDETRPPA